VNVLRLFYHGDEIRPDAAWVVKYVDPSWAALFLAPTPTPSTGLLVTIQSSLTVALAELAGGSSQKFSGGGTPPPDRREELTNLAPLEKPLRRDCNMPSVRRRFRESVIHHIVRMRDELDRLGELTAIHRRRDLLRWPKMCRRVGLEVRIAGARDVTAQQVLAVKRSGIWRTNSLKPIFSGLRTYCVEEGNPELAALGSVWRLPSRTDDRRVWLSERQLLACYARAEGRVKVRVALQGYLGMREDSVRGLLVEDLMLEDPVPRMNFPVKGPDGERLPISVDPEVAGLLRSWVECRGLGPKDRVYPVQHSCADEDLRELGKHVYCDPDHLVSGNHQGLPSPLAGHVLRRTWARIAYLANPCIDQVRRIQRVLGHQDIATTWHYIGVEYLDMEAGLALFHERMRAAAQPPGA
jgi:integrase